MIIAILIILGVIAVFGLGYFVGARNPPESLKAKIIAEAKKA